MAENYDSWTKEALVERIKLLESKVGQDGSSVQKSKSSKQEQSSASTPPKEKKPIDFSKYSTRFIALKLAYLGKNYGGFEHQVTYAASTIEQELWKALVKAFLIFPENPDEINFAPYEYVKCGRTDVGVSAFGQVINIRVRSNRPKPQEEPSAVEADASKPDDSVAGEDGNVAKEDSQVPNETSRAPKQAKPWDDINDELEYCRILNTLLPPDIRILAWCPNPPPNFSARFSCRERQYRYFFTQPACAPWPSSLNTTPSSSSVPSGWLDIDAMRQAAKLLEGLHDFRNFCKLNPSQQITNYVRRIFECDIVEVPDVGAALPHLSTPSFQTAMTPDGVLPKVYYFHVRGSAFLWHQIRHMVAIIFAVGQGFEKPSIVSDLLDIEKMPRRPGYNMASDVPLVLWDCIFPDLSHEASQDTGSIIPPDVQHKDSIDWIWVGEDKASNLFGSKALVDQIWAVWRGHKMDELLAGQLLQAVATRPNLARELKGPQKPTKRSERLFEGGNSARSVGEYQRIAKKPLLPTPEEVNDKYAQAGGFANAVEMQQTPNWRAICKAAKLDKKTKEMTARTKQRNGDQ